MTRPANVEKNEKEANEKSEKTAQPQTDKKENATIKQSGTETDKPAKNTFKATKTDITKKSFSDAAKPPPTTGVGN